MRSWGERVNADLNGKTVHSPSTSSRPLTLLQSGFEVSENNESRT